MSEAQQQPTRPGPKHPAFGDVDVYADVMAGVRDPYADRSAVLAQATLTVGALAELRDHWCARFATGEGAPALRARFEQVFTATQAVRKAAREAAPASADGMVPTPPPTRVEPSAARETAPGAGEQGAGQECQLPTFLKVAPPADQASAPTAPARAWLPVLPDPPATTETLVLDPVAIFAGISAKMPFDPRRLSAAAVPSAMPPAGRTQSGQTLELDPTALGATPPRKRLVRFDPQTGRPLATPHWEDLPSSSDTPDHKR